VKDGSGRWFDGYTTSKNEAFDLTKEAGSSEAHKRATVDASGMVYQCTGDGQRTRQLLAAGVTLRINLHPASGPPPHLQTLKSYVAYPALISDLFVTFLLMLFVPTLTISLLRALVDPIGFRTPYLFLKAGLGRFLPLGVVAAIVGVSVPLALSRVPGWIERDVASLTALSNGIRQEGQMSEFDAHPVLTQIEHFVPTNPFGALTDPNNNSGLQIAFVVIVLGCVLGSLSDDIRTRLSSGLRNTLAVIIKDIRLNWFSLSDILLRLMPVGVFFVGLTMAATMSRAATVALGKLFISITASLLVLLVLLVIWLRWRRNWHTWVKGVLKPGLGGLGVAFSTASSYAALPSIAQGEQVGLDPRLLGILNLGTTFNKIGSVVYIASAATYIYLVRLQNDASLPFSLGIVTGIVAMSVLGSVACAGLPFAAVFSVRMVLILFSLPASLAWLVFAIDPIADRLVTTMNVFGNLAACSERVGAQVIATHPAPVTPGPSPPAPAPPAAPAPAPTTG
jgi:Na+/H+-dicarboxylate symporter